MWTAIIDAVEWLLGKLFGGAPSGPSSDEKLGQQEQARGTDDAAIKELELAAQARQAVAQNVPRGSLSGDPVGPDGVRASTDPDAIPYKPGDTAL